MDEFEVGDQVVVIEGEFEGQAGFVHEDESHGVVGVTLNETAHRVFLEADKVSLQQ